MHQLPLYPIDPQRDPPESPDPSEVPIDDNTRTRVIKLMARVLLTAISQAQET